MGIFDVGCEWELDNEGSGVPWSIVIGLRPKLRSVANIVTP